MVLMNRRIFYLALCFFTVSAAFSGCDDGAAEETSATCQDGADNDGDGATDCDDSGCSAFVFCQPADGDADSDGDGDADSDSTSEEPSYFIAIHNEPYPGEEGIADAYEVLRAAVDYATARHVKLTLMFTAQWASYINSSPARVAEVQGWTEAGHEIAAHHHGIFHPVWDGYSDLGEVDANQERLACGHPPEPYLGALDEYMATVRSIDPTVVSGCVNDEPDKSELPDGVLYDTCSGFANHGSPRTREQDTVASKGINEFVYFGTWNGVERAWLGHYQVYQDVDAARSAFDSMTTGVYGVVTHSVAEQTDRLAEFIDFLQEHDPEGLRSLTVREVVEGNVLPRRELTAEQLGEVLRPPGCESSSPCGDGVCDDFERANPEVCPGDCP
jgi:hypothetical protein